MDSEPTGSSPSREANGWAAYESWNLAIEAVFFDGRHAGRPVYLDLEDDVFREAQALTGLAGDPAESLDAAVRETLPLATPSSAVFRTHVRRAIEWDQSGRNGTPPYLALLAFFSTVAESMRDDERFGSNNYYGRLCDRLQVDPLTS